VKGAPDAGGRLQEGDPPDADARLAAAEHQLAELRLRAELDRHRRLAALDQAIAETEHRERMQAEEQRRAMRAELARERFTHAAKRPLPALRLRRVDLADFRILPLA